MTKSPAAAFAPVDDATGDLLSLIAEDPHPSVDFEWDRFRAAIREAADPAGFVSQNTVRDLIRDRIYHKRIGGFYHRAQREGLLVWRGEWETSDDTQGGNAGKPCRLYRLTEKGRS